MPQVPSVGSGQVTFWIWEKDREGCGTRERPVSCWKGRLRFPPLMGLVSKSLPGPTRIDGDFRRRRRFDRYGFL